MHLHNQQYHHSLTQASKTKPAQSLAHTCEDIAEHILASKHHQAPSVCPYAIIATTRYSSNDTLPSKRSTRQQSSPVASSCTFTHCDVVLRHSKASFLFGSFHETGHSMYMLLCMKTHMNVHRPMLEIIARNALSICCTSLSAAHLNSPYSYLLHAELNQQWQSGGRPGQCSHPLGCQLQPVWCWLSWGCWGIQRSQDHGWRLCHHLEFLSAAGSGPSHR